jgi:signal transduction histidine kinase
MIPAVELVFLGAAFASGLTGAGIFSINPNRLINRIFALVLTVIALWFFTVFMVLREARIYTPATHENPLFWLRLGAATSATLPWLVQLMIPAIATPTLTFSAILKRSWPWFVIFCALTILIFSELFIPSDSTPLATKRGYGYTISFCVLLFESVIILIGAYRQMQQLAGIRRTEMQIFVINTGLASVLVLICMYIGRVFELPQLSRSTPFFFLGLYTLTVWTVCYHRIFDARQVIASLAHRITLLGILGATAAILTSLLHQSVDQPYDILLTAIGTGLVALACARATQRWFGLDYGHRLIEPRLNIVKWARQEPEADKLKTRYENFLCDWCQADRAVLLLANNRAFASGDINVSADWPGLVALCREGWITPELLQRRKTGPGMVECSELMSRHNLGALLAVPLGSDSPTLLLALGHKHGLRPYTYPDIRLLLDLGELMDNILTHANLSQHASKIAQMESAAMMSRSLAHDLNNLTTPVATYLLHSEGRATPGTAEAEVYDAALNSVKVMQDYIRESLFFSRRLIPHFKEVDPAESLASMVRLAQERAARRAVQLQSFCERQTRFSADPVLFQRLALNLVNNAIDASPPGATVTISIVTDLIEQVCLTVTDQGIGIPIENLKRIFDPYFTTKDTGDTVRGLGLGLAICRKIVDLHEGEISVTSTPGESTIFKAAFPQWKVYPNPARKSTGILHGPASLPLHSRPQVRPV